MMDTNEGCPSGLLTMEVQCDSSSGSIEPSKIELKISAGPWSIARHIDIADRSKFVIPFEKDDFGGLCPRMGLETKGLVHFGGRAAVTVQKDDRVVVLPPPHEETAAATTGGQQQSAARTRQRGQSRAGAARQGHRGSRPSRSWAGRVTGGSSGTGGAGRGSWQQQQQQTASHPTAERAAERGSQLCFSSKESYRN